MLFEEKPQISESEITAAMDFAVAQTRRCLPEFTEKFKKAYSEHNFYQPTENVDWTTGFWTGQIWLAYEETGEECFKRAGEIQIESFLNRIENKIEVDHHDMGFLYSPSCVAGCKLTGNENGKKAAILAADQLIRRFHPVGEFIQAWGPMDAPENYRLIIDCLLNLPLLYWASEETGDEEYRDIAERHIHTAVANVIREDHSTWHTFFFDMETGAPDHGATCQGYKDGSAWARGQAWAVYGYALSYRYTGDSRFLQVARRAAEVFRRNLPADWVPYWDFTFTDEQPDIRDTSAASIYVCGLLELCSHVSDGEAESCLSLAETVMRSLREKYTTKGMENVNGILTEGMYHRHDGQEESTIWGDYFYMEALMRLTRDWRLYW